MFFRYILHDTSPSKIIPTGAPTQNAFFTPRGRWQGIHSGNLVVDCLASWASYKTGCLLCCDQIWWGGTGVRKKEGYHSLRPATRGGELPLPSLVIEVGYSQQYFQRSRCPIGRGGRTAESPGPDRTAKDFLIIGKISITELDSCIEGKE